MTFRMPRLLFHNPLGPVGVMSTNRRVRRTATATRIGVRQAAPLSRILGYHSGGLLADHDRWCVGAGIQRGRHDRGIGDAQPL